MDKQELYKVLLKYAIFMFDDVTKYTELTIGEREVVSEEVFKRIKELA